MEQPSIDQHSLTSFTNTHSFTLSLQSTQLNESNMVLPVTHPPRKYFLSSPNLTRKISSPQNKSEIKDGKRLSMGNKNLSPYNNSNNYNGSQHALIGMPNRHSKSNMQIFKAPKSMTSQVKKTNIFDPKTYTWKPPNNDAHRSKRFDYNNLADMSKLNSVFF